MSNKLRDIFLPHLKWLDKSIIDANPCNTCPTYQEYKIRQQFGPIGEREYAELPDSCPCIEKIKWKGECFSKLKWYESQDKRLHPELLEEPKQPWISTEDRLPTEEDANKMGSVIAIMEHDGFPRSWWYDLVVRYPHLYPYWMPFPKPPEEE